MNENKNLNNQISAEPFISSYLHQKGYEKGKLLEREEMYILAFRDKCNCVYNSATTEQIIDSYVWKYLNPIKEHIYREFHKNYGCEILTLKYCNSDTIRRKFAKS